MDPRASSARAARAFRNSRNECPIGTAACLAESLKARNPAGGRREHRERPRLGGPASATARCSRALSGRDAESSVSARQDDVDDAVRSRLTAPRPRDTRPNRYSHCVAGARGGPPSSAPLGRHPARGHPRARRRRPRRPAGLHTHARCSRTQHVKILGHARPCLQRG